MGYMTDKNPNQRNIICIMGQMHISEKAGVYRMRNTTFNLRKLYKLYTIYSVLLRINYSW